MKRSKCEALLDSVEFLGHVVSSKGVHMVPGKVAAVADWPTPTCVRDVQAFLGLANYYRRFCRGFAAVAKPLTDLTKKGVEFAWTDACAGAFTQLKLLLTEAPVLQIFDPSGRHEVHVDASDYACGAVLLQ